jgi:hypothetical protein
MNNINIQMFSDGSINFFFVNKINLKKLKVYEKDFKNFFSNKNKIINKTVSNSSKYKNQYLF